MLSAIGYLVGSRVLDPIRLIGVVSDALLDPHDWTIRQLAVTVGTARLRHTVGLDPQAIHADRPQDPERAKAISWHPAAARPGPLPSWPADGRRGAAPGRHEAPSMASAQPAPPRPPGSVRPASQQSVTPSATPAARLTPSVASADPADPADPANLAAPTRSTMPDAAAWLSAQALIGRDVLALDHPADRPVGRLQDLVFDDVGWAVCYLIVTLHDRGPRPRRVLVGVDWLDRDPPLPGAQAPAPVDRALRLALSATQLRLSPGFEDVGSIDAALVQRLPVRTPRRVTAGATRD